MKNLFDGKPKGTFSTPEHQSAGIYDDYAVRKVMNTAEGTIEKTPVNPHDIANKAYVDSHTGAETDPLSVHTTGGTMTGGLDISWGGESLVVGADQNSSTRTNNTIKKAYITYPHYNSSASNISILKADNSLTNNAVYFGGATAGIPNIYAPTIMTFATASTNTSTSATEALRIYGAGNIRLSNLTSNGFVKTTGDNGLLSIDTNNYLKLNQATPQSVTAGAPIFTEGIKCTDTDHKVDISALNNIQIGKNNVTYGESNVAIGLSNNCTNFFGVCIGETCTASNTQCNAWGTNSVASGYITTAIGGANVTGFGGVGIGPAVTATGDGSIVFGYGSSCTHAQGIAIGYACSTDEDYMVTLGNSNNHVHISKCLQFDPISTPSNPSGSRVRLYFKSDEKLYKLNSLGTESLVGGSLGDFLDCGLSGETFNNVEAFIYSSIIKGGDSSVVTYLPSQKCDCGDST